MRPSKNTIYQQGKLKLTSAILAALLMGSIGGYEAATYWHALPLQTGNISIQVRFSPGGQCTWFTVQAIQAAQQSILVQAYSFTAAVIVDALITAHQRGIAIKILVDRSQLTAKSSQVSRVLAAGIPIAIDKVPGIAHNKVMIIDDDYVLTGSFNWTEAAEKRNAENLLLIKDRHTNSLYRSNWEKRAMQAIAIKLPASPGVTKIAY